MKTWEYSEVDPWQIFRENEKWMCHGRRDQDVLNFLGKDGWELVTYLGKWNCQTGETPKYIMKREVTNEQNEKR